MVERRKELDRRYHRKKKIHKLKRRLAASKDEAGRGNVVRKIVALSPEWTEPAPAPAPARPPAKGAK
jgi:hypothetical protein